MFLFFEHLFDLFIPLFLIQRHIQTPAHTHKIQGTLFLKSMFLDPTAVFISESPIFGIMDLYKTVT